MRAARLGARAAAAPHGARVPAAVSRSIGQHGRARIESARSHWTIRASHSTDSALVGAAQGADEALLAAAAAALTLALGLMLAIRAVRAGVALTAMRSDFVSSVTHELKTPLANIRAMADTLARRPIGGDTVRDYAELLMQEAKRLTRLVDNLLAYARVTDVTEMYSFEPIAPSELVDDVLQNFRHPLAEREFKVEVDMPVDLPLVRADRTAMMLALDNLVDNAIRYSPRERSCASRRGARTERGHRGTGSRRRHFAGGAADRAPQVRAGPARPGRRQRPRARHRQPHRRRSQRHARARQRTGRGHDGEGIFTHRGRVTSVSERILIVEDDPTLRRVLRDNLIFEGYRVDAVADGKSAINYVRTSAPDLVVLDLTLPDFDGLDLCPVLRQSGKVPIIILSARGQKADKLKGLKLGADDYITKPFDLQELLARISAVLRRAHPALERLLIGKLVIDFRSQRARCDQAPVHLTHREFELLRYLAERREKVVHREELLREVWGYVDTNVTTRSVDHAIVRLRKKIEPDPHHPEFIRTVHGDGYCLSATRIEGGR